MIEKVNPMHPDKVADRIAGAMVDYAYDEQEDPRVAVEVLIGHGKATIIAETSCGFPEWFVRKTVKRISKEQDIEIDYREFPQDKHLADNQYDRIKAGDNGIFKGMPLSDEQKLLSGVAHDLYEIYPTDGKYILADGHLICCQSNVENNALDVSIEEILNRTPLGDTVNHVTMNPLGFWTGGLNVDTGATNRKLGSDMADGVTGGGLHGKDLSKADVAVNIYAFLKAQATNEPVELYCSIGQTKIDGKPYREIVEIAREFVGELGGFEKLAEWGLF